MMTRIDRTYPIVLLALLAGPIWGQSGRTPEDAVAKQRTAAAAMQESLAKQQAAIQKQLGQTGTGSSSFFLLPRAATLGTTVSRVSTPLPIAPVADCDPLPATEIDSLVTENAERQGLSADLLRGVIKQESAFRPCAVFVCNAIKAPLD